MAGSKPRHCHARAIECLAEYLPDLNTTRGLLGAAVAVSMHEMSHAEPDAIRTQVQELTEEIARRIKSTHPRAVMAHAHDVLFAERGFKGNRADYYNPRNSYLPAVLRTGRGLPITLSLVYKCVVEPLGVTVHGINAPGHFIVSVAGSTTTDEAVPGSTLIDPFNAGRMLSHDEALAISRLAMAGKPMPKDPLAPANHQQWLVRIIQNLIAVFDRLAQPGDVAAMIEMRDFVIEQAPR